MKQNLLRIVVGLAFFSTGLFAADTALAQKPPRPGDGKQPGMHGHNVGKPGPGPAHHQGGIQKQHHRPPQKPHPTRMGHDRYRGDSRFYHDGQRYRYFREPQRDKINAYYAHKYRKGNCPPGLYRRGYRCVPPPRYQQRSWVIGRPLPRNVYYHDLAPEVLVHLGPPPSHHRFVRVAQDILLIATGTGMVVDAIDNLHWEFGR